MPAPIRKVAPNGFVQVIQDLTTAVTEADIEAGLPQTIETSLSAFGAVVSSTVPGILTRSSAARAEIRRILAVR